MKMTKSLSYRSIIVKIIGVLLVLIAIFFGVKEIKKYIKKTAHGIASIHRQSAFDELIAEVNSLSRQNSTLLELLPQIMEGAPQAQQLITQVCHTMYEEAEDLLTYAKGYNCLSEVLLKEAEKEEINVLRAITNLSYSLNALGNKEYISNLYQAILFKEKEAVLNKLIAKQGDNFAKLLTDLSFKDTKEEIQLLNALIDVGSKGVTARAKYRLSYIYQNGASFSGASPIAINYALALKYRKEGEQYYSPKTKQVLDIALIFDEGYSTHSAATIASVLFNSDPEVAHKFYIVYNPDSRPLSEETKNKLSSMSYIKKYEIEFVPFPREQYQQFNQSMKKYPNANLPEIATYRLFLSQILDLSRILYLDSDMVITRDLARLFNLQGMESYFFAAALDPIPYELSKPYPSCHINNNYINSGVLLINLEEMRKHNLIDIILDNLSTTECPFYLADQDVINYVWQDKVKNISSRWNSGFLSYPQTRFIYHYFGAVKPWNWPEKTTALSTWKNSPEDLPQFFDLYWFYRDLTPWTTTPEQVKVLID